MGTFLTYIKEKSLFKILDQILETTSEKIGGVPSIYRYLPWGVIYTIHIK